MTRQGVLWSVAALLGIVCTAAVAWSASLLAGQHIGLSGEPLSAAGRLAPMTRAPAHKPVRRHSPSAVARPTVVLPVPAQTQPATAPTATPAAPPSAPPAPSSAGQSAPATTGSSSVPAPTSPAHHDDGGGGTSRGGSDSRQRDD